MSIIDTINQAAAARQDVLKDVDINTSSNTTVTAHTLSKFAGTYPRYDYDSDSDMPVEVMAVPNCALDVKDIVLTEIRGFKQPEGGFTKMEERLANGGEANWMNQMEFTIALPGARLGFIEDEQFVAHPLWKDDSDMPFVKSRALEIYAKTPFKITDELMTEIQQAVLDHGFVPVDLGDQPRESKREDLFHLNALAMGGTRRDKIIARQSSGLQLANLTLTAPRDISNRPTDAQNQPIPEFENFLLSLEQNLHRVTVMLAAGESIPRAGSLSTAITGVNGRYPLRATTASLAYEETTFSASGEKVGSIPKTVSFFAETPAEEPA